jgi:hypothetical protein
MLKFKIVVWRELTSIKWVQKVPLQEPFELEVACKAFAPFGDRCSAMLIEESISTYMSTWGLYSPFQIRLIQA